MSDFYDDKDKALKNVDIYTNIFSKDFDTLKTLLNDRDSHLEDQDDPHEVTVEQVGLTNIVNYPIASEVDGRDATRTDAYLDLQGAHAFVRTKLSPISGVEVPTSLLPEENTLLATQSPVLSASAYKEFWGESRLTREFEIAVLGSFFTEIVWSGSANADQIAVDVPLEADTTFEWRCRDVPEHGLPSAWSAAGRFSVPNVSIDAPTVSGLDGAVALTGASVTASAFQSTPEDTHSATSWRIFEDVEGTQTLVWESLNDTTNLTGISLTGALLDPETTYVLTTQYHGATYGAGSVSSTPFTTTAASVDLPTATLAGPGDPVKIELPIMASTGYQDTLKEIQLTVYQEGVQVQSHTLTSYVTEFTFDPLPLIARATTFEVVYVGDHLGSSATQTLSEVIVSGAQTFVSTISGGSGERYAGVAAMSNNDIVAVGSNFLPASNRSDMLISRWDSSGDHLWSASIGDTESDNFLAVKEHSSGDIIAVGMHSPSVGVYRGIISRWAADGTHVWSRTTDSLGVNVYRDMAFLPGGDIIAVGNYNAGAYGGNDILISRWTADGVHVWSKGMGGSGSDLGYGVAVLPSGDFVVAGTQGSSSAGVYDGFLSRWTADGTHVWSRKVGSAATLFIYSVAVTPTGDVVMVGRVSSSGQGGNEGVVSKWSDDGTHLWTKMLGSSSNEMLDSITVLPNGNIVTSGNQNSAVYSSLEHLYACWSPSGALLWVRALGSSSNAAAKGVDVTSTGLIVSAGDANTGIYVGAVLAIDPESLPAAGPLTDRADYSWSIPSLVSDTLSLTPAVLTLSTQTETMTPATLSLNTSTPNLTPTKWE